MPPPPPAPEVHSEEWLLRQQLPPPRFGILSSIPYDPKTSGSAPFDPEKLKPYEMSSLRRRYGSYQGSNDALPNFVGPVVHDRPLFLERDDHLDLFNKVYMPLSQATRQHGVQFSVACETHHLEGVEDMSVCTVDGGSHRTTMIVEEKSENKFGHLFGDNILDKAVEGRNFNIAGLREAKNSANFQSALVLAQALGYMGSKGLIHGIIITARRAFFVLVVPHRQSTRKRRRATRTETAEQLPPYPDPSGQIILPDGQIESLLLNSEPGIYVSSAVHVNDPNYLRILAGFMVESHAFRTGAGYQQRWMSEIVSSIGTGGEGLFLRGDQQAYIPTPRSEESSGRASGSDVTRLPVNRRRSLPMIDWDEIEPLIRSPSQVLSKALGRERDGQVVKVTWNDIDVAVKVVHITKDENGRKDMQAFDSEVEAYRIAGGAGLWGVAVAEPVFISSKEEARRSIMAIGTKAGRLLPHVSRWSPRQLSQARDAVVRLYQAGVRHTDVHPRNFVAIDGPTGETTVAAIDLEFSLDHGKPNLPPWIWGQKKRGIVWDSSGVGRQTA